MSGELKALETLHVLINQSVKALSVNDAAGVRSNLESLGVALGKVRTLAKDNRPRRIGVFGPPKRGKSTLLNVFLGEDILPSGTMPTTHCVVEIHNIAGGGESRIVTYYMDDASSFEHNVSDSNEFKDALTRSFQRDSSVKRIEVYADFGKGTIPPNSVLLDTPGAEVAFENDAHDETMGARGCELADDTKRALDILADVDVPLFCMRADQTGSASEQKFYAEHMQRIKPINVINFKDAIDADEEYDIFENAINAYGLIRRDTVLVSAKNGMKAVKNNMSLEDSGFLQLQKMLRVRLERMQPVEGLCMAETEYSTIMSRLVSEERTFFLPVTYIDNFVNSLTRFDKADKMRENLMREKWYVALKYGRR